MTQKRKGVPAFIRNTYEMLQRPDLSKIVCWAENENGFIIKNLELFSSQILPQYFKHKKYTSFVRQLNMYGFHKQRHFQNQNYFYHQQFKKGDQPETVFKILTEIKRKPEKKKKNQGQSQFKISQNPQNSQIKIEEIDHSDDDKVSIKIEEDKKDEQAQVINHQTKGAAEMMDQNEGLESEDQQLRNAQLANNSLFGVFVDSLLKQNQSLRMCHQSIRSQLLRVKVEQLNKLQRQNTQNSQFEQKQIKMMLNQPQSNRNSNKLIELLQKQSQMIHQIAESITNIQKYNLQ